MGRCSAVVAGACVCDRQARERLDGAVDVAVSPHPQCPAPQYAVGATQVAKTQWQNSTAHIESADVATGDGGPRRRMGLDA